MRSIGPFTVLGPLASGGMGTVWRARHDATDTPVAIKTIRADLDADPRFRRMFQREVEAVAGLDHPNIVWVLDHGEQDGVRWLATEFASGGSLDRLPRPDRWDQVVEILVPLLDALAHAHARGVLHLDLKPANLLRATAHDLRPGLKLTDFGLAACASGTQSRAHGTVQYMAPEQFAGGALTAGADLYAAGVLAWELVSGRLPFQGTSPKSWRDAHAHAPIPPLAPAFAVPAGLHDWLCHALAKDPRERFGHAADAARALHALGPAVETGLSSTLDRAFGSTHTLDFLTGPLEPGPTGPLDVAPAPLKPAQLPRTWRGPTRPRTLTLLHDVGRGLYGVRSLPLIGRHAQRDALWDALRHVVDTGVGAGAVLHGVPGVGATALATWIGQRAAELGAVEWVSSRAGLAGLLERLPGPVPTPRERIDRLESWVRSRGRPVVLLLDQVDDQPDAWAFARRLLRQIDPLPVFVILTTHSLEPAKRLLALESVCTVELGPLGDVDMIELLGELLALDPALAAQVHARASGNPAYAVQLVGDWLARGVLQPGPRGFVLNDPDAVGLPEGLEQLWSERLDPLLECLDARGALELAAMLGPEVDAAAWRRACEAAGLDDDPEGLDELAHLGLVERTAEGWRFVQAAVLELIVDRARGPRWAALQGAVAETTTEPARRGLALAELGEGRQAGALLLQAAQRASSVERYDRTLWLYERARACLDAAQVPPGDPLRFDLAWRTLVGVSNTWNPTRSMALCETLLDDAATYGWDRARVLSLLAQLHLHAGELDHARARATQALAEPGERTRRLQVLGMVAYMQGDLDLAQDSFEQAGQGIDDHDSYLWARNLNQLAEIARKRGEYDDALRGYAQAAEVVARVGEHRDVLVSHANIGLVHLGRRDWEAAKSVLNGVLTSGSSGLTVVPHCLATVFLLRVSAEQRDTQTFDRMAAGLRRRLRLLRVFDPDMGEQAERAGAVWMRRGDPHRAAVAWRVALDQFTQLDPARAEQLAKRVT